MIEGTIGVERAKNVFQLHGAAACQSSGIHKRWFDSNLVFSATFLA